MASNHTSPIRRLSDGYPTAIRRLSDGYPTVIRRLSDGIRRYPTPGPRRPSVLRGPGPIIRRLSDGYPTAIRRLSDGYPTAVRRLSDGYPTAIRRLSDGYPMVIRSLFAAQRPPPKNQPETSYDREGPRGPKGPKHEFGASGSRVSILFAVCGCHAVGFFLGLSLACLVGLLILLKWDVCSRAVWMSLSWRSCFSLGPVAGLLGPAVACMARLMTRMSCPPPTAHRPPPCVRQQLFASKIANNICRKQAGKDNNQIRNQKKTLRKAAAQPSRPATDPERKNGSRGQQAIQLLLKKNKESNLTKNSRPGRPVTGPEQNPTAQ